MDPMLCMEDWRALTRYIWNENHLYPFSPKQALISFESADIISLRTFVCCRLCGAQRRWITEWSWVTAVQMVMRVILGTYTLLSPTGWRRTHWVCCTTHRLTVLHPSTSPTIHTSTWLDRYGYKHTVYKPYTAWLKSVWTVFCGHNRCIPTLNKCFFVSHFL